MGGVEEEDGWGGGGGRESKKETSRGVGEKEDKVWEKGEEGGNGFSKLCHKLFFSKFAQK